MSNVDLGILLVPLLEGLPLWWRLRRVKRVLEWFPFSNLLFLGGVLCEGRMNGSPRWCRGRRLTLVERAVCTARLSDARAECTARLSYARAAGSPWLRGPSACLPSHMRRPPARLASRMRGPNARLASCMRGPNARLASCMRGPNARLASCM